MRRIWLSSLMVLGVFGAPARSQFIGAGSTPQGDYLRGVGIASWGMGSYNRDTAIGYSITVDANIRGDTYIAGVLRADRDNFAKLDRQRQARYKENYETIKNRIKDHPERHDVFTGNALNAVLAQLNDPSIQEASLRSAPVAIPREMIRRIPFKLDEKGVIFSLQRLTARGKGKYPVAFQNDKYAYERKTYERAVDRALEQMIDGKVLPEAIEEYKAAVDGLSNKLESELGQSTDRLYTEAKVRINEMRRALDLLKTQKIQPIMADLDRYTGKTVDDLRRFMLEHNLKFASVDSIDERNLYIDLYAALDQVKEIVIGNGKGQDK
jgi:hypothetical protein